MRAPATLLALTLVLAACSGPGGDDAAPADDADLPLSVPPPAAASDEAAPDAWRTAAHHFLDTYVDDDGRVVRHDEGGDTVSEGQAYALLVAMAVDDEATFDRVWDWTATHLRRDDGLLAWRWADGAVVDAEFATDADLDAAHALLVASIRFERPDLADAAREISDALLEQSTVVTGHGRLLVAGRWARSSATVNPSYFSPLAFSVLYRHGGDGRWADVAAASRATVDLLTSDPPHLPPDWAVVDDAGPVPTGSPPVFGYEAVRVPWRFALDCRAEGREVAARAWSFFDAATGSGSRPPAARYDLQGVALTIDGHPAMTVAAASSAHAAGADDAAARLLDLAVAQEQERPGYYGAALVALARVGLETDRLGSCEDETG